MDFTVWSASDAASRATQEYLDTLDDAAFGAATPVKPKAISPADPAARFTGANGDGPFFACSTNYLVHLANAIIVDVEATAPIWHAEVGAVRDMLVRPHNRFDLHPGMLAADTAHGTADMLGWPVKEQHIGMDVRFEPSLAERGGLPGTVRPRVSVPVGCSQTETGARPGSLGVSGSCLVSVDPAYGSRPGV